MFRSVFSKYIITFAVIILSSFLVMSLINSSVINGYSTDSKTEDVTQGAEYSAQILAYNYLSYKWANQNSKTLGDYVTDYPTSVQGMLQPFCKKGSAYSILIADENGAILASVSDLNANPTEDSSSYLKKESLPEGVLAELRETESGVYTTVGTLEGVFGERRIICIRTVRGTGIETAGYIVSSVTIAEKNALISAVNRTIIMVSLWVLLAALIAVYFVSDRIISPLRAMTGAVKEYAQGKMETRVKAQGRDEIAQLATAFNQMADSIENTEKMRNTFLANVSHDLRTPMTTIAGFVDGILSGAIPRDSEDHYLTIVSSEVHRLSRLVQKILDVSRLESGERKMTPVRFDICELARLILISFEQKINDKHLEIDFSCDNDSMFVFSDRDAIHQVLYNLCDNALKFSRDGGAFSISIHAGDDGKDTVTVYNEGCGIPAEDLPFVFDRFYKGDKSRSLDKTGTGLGLYIVRTILTSLGESITAESEEGVYCRFRFTLEQDHSELPVK